jgi:peptidoglycan/xylan/chitin deacetylase (PgdA/CDA1 family)
VPEVCLTFDNGPDAGVTPGVLDVLARHDLRATFFVIGAKLRDRAARACAERARAEGHAIGNHTLSHGAPLGRRGATEAVAEIAEADALLGDLHGPDRLFRPNGGGGALGPHLLNRAAADHLRAQRHTLWLWNAVPGDWRDPEGWVATALGLLHRADGAAATSVMVLHDLPNGAMRHLDRFLDAALALGARFGAAPPPCCVPLRRGEPGADFDRWVAPDQPR